MAEYKLSLTASEIDEKLNKIDNLAEKNEIPSNTSDLTNDSSFITQSYVDNKIAAITIPSKLSDLTADSTHRTVTDTEKSTWNAKLDTSDLDSVKDEITEELKTYVDETILNGEW